MRFIAKILLLSAFTAATFAYAQTLPTFQHIIVIVQENRTPDNLFGSNTTFEPGVDLATARARYSGASEPVSIPATRTSIGKTSTTITDPARAGETPGAVL
jgi:phospholipase C